eukprot:Hpha_TRINITY_DN15391_c6_g5::TRINITY_DN15391_c6_g5_i1::g.90893::m.90893
MVTLFSEHAHTAGAYHIGYVTIGDEYDKRPPKIIQDPPYPTKQIQTACLKKGGGPQVTFDWQLRAGKYLSLSEGDKYKDPGADERETRRQRAEKQRQVHSTAFKHPSPAKKRTGLGNYFGCFNEKNADDGCRGFRHETEFDVLKKGEMPSRREPTGANIKIGSTKTGTYGVPGTLLSDQQRGSDDSKRWTGNEYICDPYARERDMAKKAAGREKELLAKAGHSGPWKSQCRKKGRTFDSILAPATGASQVYRLTEPLGPRKVLPQTQYKNVADVPFKPPSMGKAGLGGFFGDIGHDGGPVKFPEYREDPYEIKEQREKADRRDNAPKFGPWKPVSITKTLCTQSIEFRGL